MKCEVSEPVSPVIACTVLYRAGGGVCRDSKLAGSPGDARAMLNPTVCGRSSRTGNIMVVSGLFTQDLLCSSFQGIVP